MYEYCVAKNKFDISYWGRDDFFDLAKKVTNTASTVDYTLYGWILQELLSRTKKLKSEEPKSNTIQKHYFSHPDILPLMQSTNNASNISRPITFSPKKASKPFVFIIDEINRGEISKIFGELFFSIDPGYRGESGRVKTQYQNMIDEKDPFYEGFYVPENVYIIGTMNDIDRSVESMDFAMRRRFAWKEIKANENTGMLDSFGGLKNEIISKMNRLNNAIWNEETNEGIEGLSAAYHIGGAYFKKLELYDYENNLPEAYQQLWENHLRGVLFEYLRGSFNAADNLKKLEEVYYSKGIYE
ncbi:AAA family ATPase [Phocaeicola sp. Sa1CVN1]|uniref:AAA family ATPase n=2 Tax=Phocaeicola intestinalis TaxID=2762212 RepID=A0ABR8Y8J5_9BACT|nr:AAA family ATPase [Phocaeicola intestinalis]